MINDNRILETKHIKIYSKTNCTYCDASVRIAQQMTQETSEWVYTKYMLDEDFTREELMEMFPNARTFPQITIDGEYIGGYTEFRDHVHRTHNPTA